MSSLFRRVFTAFMSCSVFALILTIGTANTSAGAASSNSIIVGVVAPKTGSLSVIGSDFIDGVQAEAQILNAHGGVLGRQIKVVSADDGSTPQQGIAATTALTSNNNISLLVTDSALGSVLLPAAKNYLDINLAPSSGPNAAQQFPLWFSPVPTTSAQMKGVLQYVKSKLKVTKIGIFSTNDSDGTQFSGIVSSLAPKYGLSVVSSQSVADSATDVTPQLQLLRSAGAQVVVAWPPGTVVGSLMTGMQTIGWTANVASPNVILSSALPKLVPQTTIKQISGIAIPSGCRTQSGKYYNGIGNLVSQLKADHDSVQQMVAMAGSADDLALAAWAWKRAGKVNPQAAATVLNGMSKLSKSSLPTLYTYPSGTNIGFTKNVHDASNIVLPYSYWELANINTPVVEGTFVCSDL